MFEQIDRLVRQFEDGTTTRRELIAGMGALVAGVAAAGRASASSTSSKPTFQAVGLNHLALDVTDVARSREWYKKHLGMTVLRESEHNCFMDCGPHFVALFKADKAGMNHYCYSIPNYTPDGAVKTLKAAGLEPVRRSDRVYFDDPDGLTVQVASEPSGS